jgi:hypothetical protein
MCVYCLFADHLHKYIPDGPVPNTPIQPGTPWSPWTPSSPLPTAPWSREQFDEAMEILRRIKEMEDKLGGCPCEDPSKLDFLKRIEERLDRLEQAKKEADNGREPSGETHPVSE